jgi:hypothetical protein
MPRDKEPIGEDTVATTGESEQIALDPKIQEELGRIFQSYCDDLVKQPIPDRFVALLAQLEAKERK